MSPSASTIILEYVCPALGTITANQMFAAPYKDVQKAVARGSLGDLNPLPWAFMLGNCCGWVTYSILTRNLFVFFANCPGFLLAAWFNLAASKLLFQQQFTRVPAAEDAVSTTSDESPTKQDETNEENRIAAENTAIPPTYKTPKHDYWVMGMIVFWTAVLAIIGFGRSFSDDTRQLIVGLVVNLNLVFFYGAPLSTIMTVLRTRNSASIHFWTMLTNTVNGAFWTAYGLAVLDYFIFVPNGLGAILGVIQIVLYVVFPRGESETVDLVCVPTTHKKDEAAAKASASSKTAAMVENSESPLSLPFGSSTTEAAMGNNEQPSR